jgi:phage-related protein
MSTLANISVAASLEKSKLSSSEPWYALVDITWPNGEHLRLVRNTDDITFDARDGNGPQTYTAFNWEFDQLEMKSDGSLPTWGVRCSNVNRAVEALIEPLGGGVGGSIAVYVVNAARLKREPELELYFQILESTSDATWVHFKLGAPNPFRLLYPRHVYTADRCIWHYKSAECGYTGNMLSCSYKIGGSNGCRAHNNQSRFGAFPGIDSNGIRAVTIR